MPAESGGQLCKEIRQAKEGTPLDYLVEVTLKDDERGDPLVNEDSLR